MSIYQTIDNKKAIIDQERPFEGFMLEQLRDYYKIGLTWSSNALEGNTLTISETKVILEDGFTIGGKPLRDTLETVGHGEAYDYMFSLINHKTIDLGIIKRIHRLFYQGIDDSNAGVWRNKSVIVSGSNYEFPQCHMIEPEMQALSEWILTERARLHPVEFAALLHLKFVTVHPFIDGNGRTARLIMNLALVQDGYQLAVIPPVCKADYNSLIATYQNKGDAKPFSHFIAERVLESEREIIRFLHLDNNKE